LIYLTRKNILDIRRVSAHCPVYPVVRSLLGKSPESAMDEQEHVPLGLKLRKFCNRLTAARECASWQRALDEISVSLSAQREREKCRAVLAPDQDDRKRRLHMDRVELCVCGHPQALHRTYGCTGWHPNADPKKTDRVWCQCRIFHAKQLIASSSRDFKFSRTA